MRPLPTLILLAALSPVFAWITPASAEPSGVPENLTLAQAERMAADLRQGMSIGDVQTLLGKPRRTALKSNTGSSSMGTLQWNYTWTGSTAPGNLRIDFVSKTSNAWYVNSWEWANY